MPSLRTQITEIATGLGMLGAPDLDTALASRPDALRHVDDDTWQRLRDARHGREHDLDFLAAWNNGRAFLSSAEALRGRPPAVVEWKGEHRDPGDHVVPSDLRVDHVYLVSCKYLSNVLHNASPWALFDQHLLGGARRADGDWFDTVAPREHQELYRLVRRHHGADLQLPEAVTALTKDQRRALRRAIPKAWDRTCAEAYAALCATASAESAQRWSNGLGTSRARAAMLWRLLRLSSAPYFVLGTSSSGSLRLRVDTPWDFTNRFRVRALSIQPGTGGQPTVDWAATVQCLDGADDVEVRGHVEVRWSHGRFAGPPEAKVYLDTPHHRVPGYVALG